MNLLGCDGSHRHAPLSLPADGATGEVYAAPLGETEGATTDVVRVAHPAALRWGAHVGPTCPGEFAQVGPRLAKLAASAAHQPLGVSSFSMSADEASGGEFNGGRWRSQPLLKSLSIVVS